MSIKEYGIIIHVILKRKNSVIMYWKWGKLNINKGINCFRVEDRFHRKE